MVYNPNQHHNSEPNQLPYIRRPKHLHHTRTIHKSRSENAVCISKHSILQTHNNELTAPEPCPDQTSDVLCVRKIERRVDFVQDVHRRWRVLEEGEDEGQRNQGSSGENQ